jgi:hypothetical protein
MLEKNNGKKLCGVNRNTQRSFTLEIMFFGFPREKRHIWANSKKDGLNRLRYNIAHSIT